MEQRFLYTPSGVCSRQIDIVVDGHTLKELSFEGGCSGNLQGISALAKGRDIESVISTLEGICCGSKDTSCPDQLAKALREISNSL